ncbi:MAG: MBL fold metallo-hydrolase [Candidatus Taylorbacteria bacterium]|nr:MBL fold metallo-hydrolase [Candidatus Taylorbacteria bacterium]
MVITYQGGEFVKLQFGDITLACNPVSKNSKLPQTRFGADVCLVSADHPDFNGSEQVAHGEKKPFIIDGAGEYEVKGIFIQGFGSKTNFGGKESINTIYKIVLEGMNICFLGALSDQEISKEADEALDNIDILFVPIGGNGVLDPSKAYKLAVSLEPKLIIPIHFGEISDNKDALKTFLKEAGESATPVDKLTLKKKDLDGKEGDVVVLQAVS